MDEARVEEGRVMGLRDLLLIVDVFCLCLHFDSLFGCLAACLHACFLVRSCACCFVSSAGFWWLKVIF